MVTLSTVLQAVADYAPIGKMGAAIGAGIAVIGAGFGIGANLVKFPGGF